MANPRLVTRYVPDIYFGPSGWTPKQCSLEAGLRVQPIPGEPGMYWLDEFPEHQFPAGSIARHDAVHYGVRLTREQVTEVSNG